MSLLDIGDVATVSGVGGSAAAAYHAIYFSDSLVGQEGDVQRLIHHADLFSRRVKAKF